MQRFSTITLFSSFTCIEPTWLTLRMYLCHSKMQELKLKVLHPQVTQFKPQKCFSSKSKDSFMIMTLSAKHQGM